MLGLLVGKQFMPGGQLPMDIHPARRCAGGRPISGRRGDELPVEPFTLSQSHNGLRFGHISAVDSIIRRHTPSQRFIPRRPLFRRRQL